MWWRQFIGPYDYLVLTASLMGLITSGVALWAAGWTVFKAIPFGASDFTKAYYQYNWHNHKSAYDKLTDEAVGFLKSLSKFDEERVRRGIGMMVMLTTPAITVDLPFSAKVSTTTAILPFPQTGPWLGDGQFTNTNEVEFLIDKGLVREASMDLMITSERPLDLYHSNKLISIRVSKPNYYKAYFATRLARELILAGSDQEYWWPTMVARLQHRIFRDISIQFGSYKIRTEGGQRWTEPYDMKLYSENCTQ